MHFKEAIYPIMFFCWILGLYMMNRQVSKLQDIIMAFDGIDQPIYGIEVLQKQEEIDANNNTSTELSTLESTLNHKTIAGDSIATGLSLIKTFNAPTKCTVQYSNYSNIFIHAGPPKTGTTTLQDHFACQTSFLREHNTIFLGKNNPKRMKKLSCKGVKDFVRPMVQYKSKKGMKRLRRETRTHISQRQNVIISDEDFHSVPLLVDSLFSGMNASLPFHIFPVVVYREYHDWIASLYYFTYHPKWYQKEWDGWTEMLVVPTFRQFLAEDMNKPHLSIELVHRFQKLIARVYNGTATNSCVKVFNLHSGDLAGKFNSLITGSTNSSLSPIVKDSNRDKGTPFAVDSEILALKLKSNGFLHPTLPRRMVVDILQKKMESLYGNITSSMAPPLDCLNEVEEQLFWKKTENSEQTLLGMGLIDEVIPGQETLLQRFQKVNASKKYCNVLFDEMIKEEAWEKFLPCFSNSFAKDHPCKKQLQPAQMKEKKKILIL